MCRTTDDSRVTLRGSARCQVVGREGMGGREVATSTCAVARVRRYVDRTGSSLGQDL